MNSQRITNGAVLIIVGAFFLLRNIGVNISIPWTQLISLWPIFIVIFGLQMIFPRGIMAFLAPLLLILALVVAFVGLPGFEGPLITRDFPLTESNSQARLELNLPIADVEIDSLPAHSDFALQTEYKENAVSQATSFHGGSHSVYTLRGYENNRGWLQNRQGGPVLAQLHPTLLWDIHIDGGIVKGLIDLRDIKWQKLTVQSGIADLTIRFPAVSSQNQLIDIKNGIGQLILEIPGNLNLEIASDGIKLNNFEEAGFIRMGNRYVSPGYMADRPHITANIESGISRIKVEVLP